MKNIMCIKCVGLCQAHNKCPIKVSSDHYLNQHPWCLEIVWELSILGEERRWLWFFFWLCPREKGQCLSAQLWLLLRGWAEFWRPLTTFSRFSLRCLPWWGPEAQMGLVHTPNGASPHSIPIWLQLGATQSTAPELNCILFVCCQTLKPCCWI